MLHILDIRPLALLDHDELVMLARMRAESGEPMRPHGFTGGQAATFERTYLERERQLRAEQEG